MSMTVEEAIKHLLHDWIINLGCDFAIKPGRLDDFLAALDVALSALRGPTREQVEKVWRGEWLHKKSPYDYKIFVCKRCGKQISIQGGPLIFCPACGSPMTDKAVDMVMERLEALYE